MILDITFLVCVAVLILSIAGVIIYFTFNLIKINRRIKNGKTGQTNSATRGDTCEAEESER